MIELIEEFHNFCLEKRYAKVALLLGYTDTNAIKKWISSGKIPAWQEPHVRKLLKSGGKKNENYQGKS